MNMINRITSDPTQFRVELPAQQFEFDALKFNLAEMRWRLNMANSLTTSIIESAAESIMITDARSIIRSVNPAFERATGYSAGEAIGRTPAILKSGRHDRNFYRNMWDALNQVGQWQGEIWNRHKNGEIFPEWLNISAVKDSQQAISHYVGVFSDAHTQEYILERLNYLAYYDILTGLPNRPLFMDRLNMSISHARRERLMLAVMFIDLDQFKQINDTFGHKTGDEVLVDITKRMKSCLREEDTLARLAGDEFTVILPGLPHPDAAGNVAAKLLESCALPLNTGGHELRITASIGISVFPGDGENADDLLRHADLAMHSIKESGRNGYLQYTHGKSSGELSR
ncbi:MAG TPA: diguanylate cyclase [Gallionella sp.]|nr:diguanylate cyclase [Gallionella sp.]